MHLSFTGERYVPELRGQIYYEHFHRYAMVLELARDKDVLDIACGEGYGTAALALVARSALGVDVDPATVRHAGARYTAMNVDFRAGECTQIPAADDSFDLVVSFETIEHLTQQERMLAEIRRVLRPAGKLVISSPNKLVYSDRRAVQNPFHERELYFDEFRDMLRAVFPAVRVFGQRIFAASAVHPLRGAATETRWLGPALAADRGLSALPEPEYFIAICGPESEEPPDLSSVYLDPRDELLDDIRSGGLSAEAHAGALSGGERATALPSHGNGDTRERRDEIDAGARLRELEDALRERQAAVESLEATVRERQGAFEELERGVRRRETAFEELERDVRGRDATIAELQQRLHDAGATVQRLEAAFVEREAEARAAGDRTGALNAALEALDARLHERDRAYAEIEAALRERVIEAGERIAQVQHMTEHARGLETLLSEEREHTAELEARLREQEARLGEQEARLAEQEARLAEHQARLGELDGVQQAREELEQRAQSLSDELEAQRLSINHVENVRTQEARFLAERVAELERFLDDAQRVTAEREELLARTAAEREELLTRTAAERDELHSRKTHEEHLQVELTRVRQPLIPAARDAATYRAELEHVREENASFRRRVAASDVQATENDALRAAAERARREADLADEARRAAERSFAELQLSHIDCAELAERAQSAERLLQDLLGSASWRMTLPARRLMGALRRGRPAP
jgi:SAM-dependent methyltransferase